MEPDSAASSAALVPTADRVASTLRARIDSGAYAPGQWLPTQRALALEFGVNRRAVNAAVARLAGEGLLRCQTGCRPIVLKNAKSGLRRVPAAQVSRPSVPSPRAAASRLVALVMWHGGFEQGATSQQRIFWGMNQALAQAGCHGVFLDLGGDIGTEQENATREAARLQYVLDHDFAGVVFYAYAYRSNRELVKDVAEQVPMVLIDRMLPGLQCDFVGVDNFGAMRDATDYLIGLGHRRIAYLTRLEPVNTVHERQEGYRYAMANARLAESVVTSAPFTEWSLFDSTFRRPAATRPTALLCVNDYEAVKAANRLASLDLTIPDDVSLVGFDDIVQVLPFGATLTTVAQPFEEIGAAAARLLVDRQNGSEKQPAHIELPANLVVRTSSGAPADSVRPDHAAPVGALS